MLDIFIRVIRKVCRQIRILFLKQFLGNVEENQFLFNGSQAACFGCPAQKLGKLSIF